jgi:phage gp16-like protein
MRAMENPEARKKELAQIHMAVADLKWDDGHYRAVLFAKTGKRSAGELDSTGRKRFIEHLKACGWTGGRLASVPRLTKQQFHVRMLWKELGQAGALEDRSDAALNAFIARLVGVADLRFLDTPRGSQVIEALKSWLLRAGRKKDGA